MSKNIVRTLVPLIAWIVFVLALPIGLRQTASAQGDQQKQETSTDPVAMKKLVERINKLEAEVDRLKNGAPVVVTAVLPGSYHFHNLAQGRELMWSGIIEFARELTDH